MRFKPTLKRWVIVPWLADLTAVALLIVGHVRTDRLAMEATRAEDPFDLDVALPLRREAARAVPLDAGRQAGRAGQQCVFALTSARPARLPAGVRAQAQRRRSKHSERQDVRLPRSAQVGPRTAAPALTIDSNAAGLMLEQARELETVGLAVVEGGRGRASMKQGSADVVMDPGAGLCADFLLLRDHFPEVSVAKGTPFTLYRAY